MNIYFLPQNHNIFPNNLQRKKTLQSSAVLYKKTNNNNTDSVHFSGINKKEEKPQKSLIKTSKNIFNNPLSFNGLKIESFKYPTQIKLKEEVRIENKSQNSKFRQTIKTLPKGATVLLDNNGLIVMSEEIIDRKPIKTFYLYNDNDEISNFVSFDENDNIIKKRVCYDKSGCVYIPLYGSVSLPAGAIVDYDKSGNITYIQTGKRRTDFWIDYDENNKLKSIRYESTGLLDYYKVDENGQLLNITDIHCDFTNKRKDLFGDLHINSWAEFSDAPQHINMAWKMHLFSDEEFDYQELADKVIPYLKKNGIYFKTINLFSCPELLTKKQAGKAFSIYPSSIEQMEKIAKDLDKIIRENNLTISDSHIAGDRQMGDTGRLFYRYVLSSKNHKDKIFFIKDRNEEEDFMEIYEGNRGGNNYLAKDMTPDDDIWLTFNPADENSHFKTIQAVVNNDCLENYPEQPSVDEYISDDIYLKESFCDIY